MKESFQTNSFQLFAYLLFYWAIFQQIILGLAITHYYPSSIGILHWLFDHIFPIFLYLLIIFFPGQLVNMLNTKSDTNNSTLLQNNEISQHSEIS